MASENTCDSVYHFGSDAHRCELPADHVEPTAEQPQGTPHRNAKFVDVLTDEPSTWWG